MSPIRARSRRPVISDVSMLSKSSRASFAVRTGVFPSLRRASARERSLQGSSVQPADDEPVKEHSDGGQVLLYGRGFVGQHQLLDVRGDDNRLDEVQLEAAASRTTS